MAVCGCSQVKVGGQRYDSRCFAVNGNFNEVAVYFGTLTLFNQNHIKNSVYVRLNAM